MDNVGASLEAHRFRINSADRMLLHRVRSGFERVQKKYPQIKGVAFFGSRTKGRSKAESDLDMYIFYDGSEIINPYDTDTLLTDPVQESKAREFHMTAVPLMISNARKILMEAAGNLPSHQIVFEVDISQAATDTLLQELIDDPNIPGGYLLRKIYSRFMLGIGDGLYKNRKYILDRLENAPNGQEVFSRIMTGLASFERKEGEGAYKRYPASIEAKRYFQVKT